MTTCEYTSADEALEAGDQWIKNSNKMEKLAWLKTSCSPEFIKTELLKEMASYMYEYQFVEIFERLRKERGVKTPQEFAYENS